MSLNLQKRGTVAASMRQSLAGVAQLSTGAAVGAMEAISSLLTPSEVAQAAPATRRSLTIREGVSSLAVFDGEAPGRPP